MIPRYSHPEIVDIFSDQKKLLTWQDTELAVIKARVVLGLIDPGIEVRIRVLLQANPPDVEWWRAKDHEIHHDLMAFIAERVRQLTPELQSYFHDGMTSYDTEEAAFARTLIAASAVVEESFPTLKAPIVSLAQQYRHTPMLERTHGQGAKLRSFGGRMLTYIPALNVAYEKFEQAIVLCHQSRLSGAIGNYGGTLTPEIEEKALEILGLRPFLGATQIMPRVVYVPLAQSLVLITETLEKIALDIRLGARSGLPICHEPFGPKQVGSSAMPHKKNTILTENMKGMALMARHFAGMITETIPTWEARSIEQSCVERVAWPDLFHVVLRMISVMTRVLEGLVVYPDNMLQEIVEARGTYASDEAKGFLAAEFGNRGIPAKTAYGIVQLASFCIFEPAGLRKAMRSEPCANLEQADNVLGVAEKAPKATTRHLRDIIRSSDLSENDQLEIGPEDVQEWNELLQDVFSDGEVASGWNDLFQPSYLLHQEAYLFDALME